MKNNIKTPKTNKSQTVDSFKTIMNPTTGKMVQSGGQLGKKLIKDYKADTIYNPLTKKQVKTGGSVGKKVLSMYRGGAPPAAQAPPAAKEAPAPPAPATAKEKKTIQPNEKPENDPQRVAKLTYYADDPLYKTLDTQDKQEEVKNFFNIFIDYLNKKNPKNQIDVVNGIQSLILYLYLEHQTSNTKKYTKSTPTTQGTASFRKKIDPSICDFHVSRINNPCKKDGKISITNDESWANLYSNEEFTQVIKTIYGDKHGDNHVDNHDKLKVDWVNGKKIYTKMFDFYTGQIIKPNDREPITEIMITEKMTPIMYDPNGTNRYNSNYREGYGHTPTTDSDDFTYYITTKKIYKSGIKYLASINKKTYDDNLYDIFKKNINGNGTQNNITHTSSFMGKVPYS